MNQTLLKKTLLATGIALALGTTAAEAALVTNVLGTNTTYFTDRANFTMLSPSGGLVGGHNKVSMTWDGSGFSNSSDYTGPGSVANVTATSTQTVFFGHNWTTHDIQIFLPGSYAFDVKLGGGGGNNETGMLNMTVGAGQLGLHMLFDWNGNLDMDVAMVFELNSVFGSGLLYSTQTNSKGQFTCDSAYTGTITQNCLFDGGPYDSAGVPVKNQVWMLASADDNGDGVMGIPMAGGGPFGGFNWNFNAFAPTAVPIPAAPWLLGSGLLGLVGAARRRRQT